MPASSGARSGKLTRDPHGEHHYPCGQTTVALELDQAAQLALRGQPVEATIHTLHVTADDAASFAEAVAGNRAWRPSCV